MRRAVSSAYYALFHCLARNCADTFIGSSGANGSKHAWRQVYRSLEHGIAKGACGNKTILAQFPDEIVSFAAAFTTMQEKRHSADYDPSASPFLKSDVVQDIDMVGQVLADFHTTSIKDRRAFAAHVLLRKRS